MGAKDDILKLLKERKSEGVLQSELYELKYSKSTIVDALEKLLDGNVVIRKKVGKKQYRIWLIEHAPFPIRRTIRIGLLKAVEYPHVLLAAEEIKKRYNVIVKIFKNALEATRALALCQLDIACSPLITQVMHALVSKSIKIYAGCGFNGSGIVFKKEKPKCYACSELSTMEMNLKYYLKEKNIDITKADIRYFKDPERMMERFFNCEVEAIAIWEPYLTKLKKFKIVEFKDVLGRFPCCTLAANNRFVEVNKDIFKEFLYMYKKCSSEIYERKEEAIQLMRKYFGFDEEILRESFGKFEYSYKISLDDILKNLERFGISLTKTVINEIFDLCG